MDVIVMFVKNLWAVPLFRVFVLGWVAVFAFFVVLSLFTATVPDRRLYAAGPDEARKASLRAIRDSYAVNPEKWLLYEDEIFFVHDPGNLTPAEREAYDLARLRCVDGGREARQVGVRVRISRSETRRYLRFFYKLHKERRTPEEV